HLPVLEVGLEILDPRNLVDRALVRVDGLGRASVDIERRQHFVVVLNIHQVRHTDVLEMANASALPRLLARLGENGKEDRGEDGDNGYHDKKLDEGKAGRSPGVEPLHLPAPPAPLLEPQHRRSAPALIPRQGSGTTSSAAPV